MIHLPEKKASTRIDQRKTNLGESGQFMCKPNSDRNKGAKKFGEPELIKLVYYYQNISYVTYSQE